MSVSKSSFLISLSLLTGCASTPRQKIIRNIIVAGVAGYAIGSQKQENSKAYGLYYAGLAGSAAGLASAYLENDDAENERLRADNRKLKAELDKVYSPSLVHEGNAMMNAKVPDKYKAMINPGEWKIYAYDQWVEDGENRLIHQDKIMELIPPSLTPKTLPLNVKGSN